MRSGASRKEMKTTGMNTIKRFGFLTVLVALVAGWNPGYAQEDNLVPNGSFENSDLRKLKKQGELELYTEDWFSATESMLDLYGERLKSEKVNIPNNAYGVQDASDGVCYAGMRAYTKDPKMSRTYFEVELMTELEKNQLYCVSFCYVTAGGR